LGALKSNEPFIIELQFAWFRKRGSGLPLYRRKLHYENNTTSSFECKNRGIGHKDVLCRSSLSVERLPAASRGNLLRQIELLLVSRIGCHRVSDAPGVYRRRIPPELVPLLREFAGLRLDGIKGGQGGVCVGRRPGENHRISERLSLMGLRKCFDDGLNLFGAYETQPFLLSQTQTEGEVVTERYHPLVITVCARDHGFQRKLDRVRNQRKKRLRRFFCATCLRE
jgi:hypothetical protein